MSFIDAASLVESLKSSPESDEQIPLRMPDLPGGPLASSYGLVRKRRQRRKLNCDFCRRRKKKCDRQMPCSSCIAKNDGNCTYPSTGGGGSVSGNESGRDDQDIDDFDEEDIASEVKRIAQPGNGGASVRKRLDKLESLLMAMIVQKQRDKLTAETGGTFPADAIVAGNTLCKQTEETPYKVTSSSATAAASGAGTTPGSYNANGTSPDDDIDSLNQTLGMLKLNHAGKAVYHGDTHWAYHIMQLMEVQKVFKELRAQQGMEEVPDEQLSNTLCMGKELNDEEFPDLGFAGVKQPTTSHDVLKTIPQRDLCERLLDRYFASIEPVFHIVHRPSFDEQFTKFWIEPEKTELLWVAMMLGMLTVAVQTYPNELVPHELQGGKLDEMAKGWLRALEVCAVYGRLTFKPSLINIRVMLLWILIKMYRKDWIDKSWTQMGILVRTAQSMGMHRDPSYFGLPPFEAEERRRLWSLLLFLDCAWSVGQGLPFAINCEEQDVRSPANINDWDIMPRYSHLPVSRRDDQRTDSTYMRCRARLAHLRRKAFVKNLKIEGTKDSLSFDSVWALDAEIEKGYKSLPEFMIRPSAMDSAITEAPEETIQKFMLEMDYLKTKVVLHRVYARHEGENVDKYKGSRAEVAESSLRILELYDWFYRSPAALQLRQTYWLIMSTVTYNYFNHALMYLLMSLSNHYDQIEPELRSRFLKAVYSTEQTLDESNRLIMIDPYHLKLVRAIVSHIKQIASMTIEERYRRRQNYLNQKRQPTAKPNVRRGAVYDLDARDATVDVNYLSASYSSPESYNSAMGVDATLTEPSPNWPFTDVDKMQGLFFDQWDELGAGAGYDLQNGTFFRDAF